MKLPRLALEVKLPATVLDHMETGFGRFDLGRLLRLARFYGKTISISLRDAPPE